MAKILFLIFCKIILKSQDWRKRPEAAPLPPQHQLQNWFASYAAKSKKASLPLCSHKFSSCTLRSLKHAEQPLKTSHLMASKAQNSKLRIFLLPRWDKPRRKFLVCKTLRITFKAYTSHSPTENKRAEQAPIGGDLEFGMKTTRKSSVDSTSEKDNCPASPQSVIFLQHMVQHWEGGMTGLHPLHLSPFQSLPPSQQWKGCGILDSADLVRRCRRLSRTVNSTVGLISLLTTRSALDPCQHIPKGP